MPLPVAFLVMPFGRKATGLRRTGVPPEVDFDALWDRVYQPVLTDLGYRAVRADRDVGALIIAQMIQRLALADLIVADLTLPNANVYYEVGVRHAAKESGCVLTSADWARPVFDLAQMRQIRYPLASGVVDEATAAAAASALRDGLAALVEGRSPVFDSIPGYPPGDLSGASAFEELVGELSRFQARARSVRVAPRAERRALAQALVEEYGRTTTVMGSVALELLLLLRDCAGWKEVADYASSLPERVRRQPVVREQHYLAMAQSGDPAALGLLDQLIAEEGESAERRGILGGRYKRLHEQCDDEIDRRRYLDLAIRQYELGMAADLNAYYPSSNLPRLYRRRGEDGDERKAADAAVIALAACRRALARGEDDGWLRPTLLGAAFDAGHVDEARRLVPEIRRDDSADWQLRSTVDDLRLSVRQQTDPLVAERLRAVLRDLEALIPLELAD